jgi:hypothetical protein
MQLPPWVIRYQRLLLVLCFLVVLALVFSFSGLRGHMSLAYVQEQLQGHPVQGFLTFVLLFVLGNLVQIPGWLFLAAAVLALGQGWGCVVTYLAAGALAGRRCLARAAQPLGAQSVGAARSPARAQRGGGAGAVSNPACAELRLGHVGHPVSRVCRGNGAGADFAFDVVLRVF